MNISLVIFFCQLLTIISRAQNQTDEVNMKATAENTLNFHELSNVTKSSLDILKNLTKFFGQYEDNSMSSFLPIVSGLTNVIGDIGHLIKEQLGNNGSPSIQSTISLPNDKSANNQAIINQSTTECRGKSSSPYGGMNCVTKEFSVSGFTTILVLLGLSLAMKHTQQQNEPNWYQSKSRVSHHMPVMNKVPQMHRPPHMRSPNNHHHQINGHPMPQILPRLYKYSDHNIPATNGPYEFNIVNDPRRTVGRSLENFDPVQQSEENGEIFQEYN